MSVDLLMYKGDLGLIKERDGTYDLAIEEAGESLLRRTVITPPSWIRMWTIENDEIQLLDDNYGDGIYLQLSDPLTHDWVTKAKKSIETALAFLDEEKLIINNTSISLASSNGIGLDTANIEISYSYKGVNKTYQEIVRV